MKLTWIRRLSLSETPFSRILYSMYPKLKNIFDFGTEYLKIVAGETKNSFWCDVIKHLQSIRKKTKPCNFDEFNADYLFYNSKITVGRKIVFYRSWVESGILQICHIMNDNGGFLSYNEFAQKYPQVNSNFIQYQGLVESVKLYRRNIQLPHEADYQLTTQREKCFRAICTNNEAVRSIFQSCNFNHASIVKWNSIFDNLNWQKIFDKCHKTTKDCTLRWFQMKILYRILPTNRFLWLRNIKESNHCTFCEVEEETLCHLLFTCNHVQRFWNDLRDFLIIKCPCIINLAFTEELVLFGCKPNMYTDMIFDLILLNAKYFIFVNKCKDSIPTLNGFKHILKNIYQIEKGSCTNPKQFDQFKRNWFQYDRLVNED